jgi:hypothetical protein
VQFYRLWAERNKLTECCHRCPMSRESHVACRSWRGRAEQPICDTKIWVCFSWCLPKLASLCASCTISNVTTRRRWSGQQIVISFRQVLSLYLLYSQASKSFLNLHTFVLYVSLILRVRFHMYLHKNQSQS